MSGRDPGALLGGGGEASPLTPSLMRPPYNATTAAPVVICTELPSMFAGIGGSRSPFAAAAARAFAALNVNIADWVGTTTKAGDAVTLGGSFAGASTDMPIAAPASSTLAAGTGWPPGANANSP